MAARLLDLARDPERGAPWRAGPRSRRQFSARRMTDELAGLYSECVARPRAAWITTVAR